MPFKDISGHERQTELLQNAVLSESVSHAYLFYGPEGVGKKLVARTLAQALNCERKDGDSCGNCRSCRNIQKENHPDILFLQPDEGCIRIEEIRAIQKTLGLRAYEGRWKVAIVDGCEEMSVAAANAFLKTLEDPPDRTTIILICPNYQSLLPTIFSRCQRIGFNPLHDQQIQDILLAKKEIKPAEVETIVYLADGSPGLALSMDLHSAAELREEAFDLIFKNNERNIVELFTLGKKTSGLKERLKELLGRLLVLVRDIEVMRTTGNVSFIKNKDMIPKIQEFSKKLKPNASQMIFEAVSETLASLRQQANPQLAMDSLLMKINEHSVKYYD